MRIRHSVSVLALLLILSAISGCKRLVTTSVSTSGDIELSPYHTPVIYAYEGQVLKFHPSSGALTLTFDQGLCKESGPVHGTHDQPAVCTIAKQTFQDDNPNKYTLTVSGSDGVPYIVYVKPCTGFCH
ncbi:MAG: hypothetical protein ACJ72H_14760 [Candidatus Sulfotelmatobacter sp.]